MPTIAEMRKNLDYLFKHCETPEDIRKSWTEILDKYEDNSVLEKLIEIVSAQVSEVEKLNNAFSLIDPDMFHHYLNQEKPLIVFHPTDPTLLRVYPNIIISSFDLEDLKSVSMFDADNVFKKFFEDYNKDMNDIASKQKWEPLDRAVKRLELYQDMPTARALSRYTTLDTTYPPEKSPRLRDFAVGVDDFRKPMELSFASSPEDFATMYGSGPSSCMSRHGGNSNRFAWMFDSGFCPASFYAFFPYTRGAYIQKGKKIIARTILFKYPDKDKWYYGTTYCDNGEIEQKFRQSLELKDITSLTKSVDYTHKKVYEVPDGLSFKIPGYSYKKKGMYCMPWPYFDNMDYHGRGFHASFDNNTKEFTITYQKEGGSPENMLPVNNQDGVLLSTDYSDRKCDFCNTLHNDRHFTWLNSNDGKNFDSLECMLQAGYVRVRTVAGEGYQLPDNHIIPIKGLRKSVFFSTLKVATDNGYFPVLHEDGSIPEEGDIEVTNKYSYFKNIDDICYVSNNPIPEEQGLQIVYNQPKRNIELIIDEKEYAIVAHP